VCVLRAVLSVGDCPLRRRSPPPPFIDTRRGGVHAQGDRGKSSSSPRTAGVQWSSTMESTLWGMAPGVAVILGGALGPAEIAPLS
jgi:hypothetical protein